MELDEAETEGEPVPMPSAWSYLKDSSPTLTCFARESFTTVGVSQYMPQLDSASYKETIALGLADTTQGAVEQASELMAGQEGDTREGAAQGTVELQASNLTGSSDEVSVTLDDALSLEGGSEEDGAEVGEIEQYDADYPVVDASLVADTTNVIAAALAQIMDPTT